MLQWSKTRAVDRPAKMYKNSFIFVTPDVALLTPWMQKSLKIVENLILHGSDQFSVQNPRNFGDWCKVLPERGQKRSGHENHGILQSVTWPCSKPDFSRTFEGSPSRIFGDFRRFHDFASFFYVVLNASRKQIASRYVHFLGFCMDPNNFRFKIRLEQSVGGRARREAGQFEVY